MKNLKETPRSAGITLNQITRLSRDIGKYGETSRKIERLFQFSQASILDYRSFMALAGSCDFEFSSRSAASRSPVYRYGRGVSINGRCIYIGIYVKNSSH